MEIVQSMPEGYTSRSLTNERTYRPMAEAVRSITGNLYQRPRWFRNEDGQIYSVVAARGQDLSARFLGTIVPIIDRLPINVHAPHAYSQKKPIESMTPHEEKFVIRLLGAGEQKVAFLLEFGGHDRKVIVVSVKGGFSSPSYLVPPSRFISFTGTKIMPERTERFSSYSDARVFLKIPIVDNRDRKEIAFQEFVAGHPSDDLKNPRDPLDFSQIPIGSFERVFNSAASILQTGNIQALIKQAKDRGLRQVADRGYSPLVAGGLSELMDHHILLEQRPGGHRLFYRLGINGYQKTKISLHPAIIDLTLKKR